MLARRLLALFSLVAPAEALALAARLPAHSRLAPVSPSRLPPCLAASRSRCARDRTLWAERRRRQNFLKPAPAWCVSFFDWSIRITFFAGAVPSAASSTGMAPYAACRDAKGPYREPPAPTSPAQSGDNRGYERG